MSKIKDKNLIRSCRLPDLDKKNSAIHFGQFHETSWPVRAGTQDSIRQWWCQVIILFFRLPVQCWGPSGHSNLKVIIIKCVVLHFLWDGFCSVLAPPACVVPIYKHWQGPRFAYPNQFSLYTPECMGFSVSVLQEKKPMRRLAMILKPVLHSTISSILHFGIPNNLCISLLLRSLLPLSSRWIDI